jgi:dihydroorotase-like cyclic amidohydrolase
MGTSSVDNFESGSKAALAGGTTTVSMIMIHYIT